MTIGRFYAMIGALIWDRADGRYLILKRSAEKDFGAGAWECLTGRVDQGEGFVQALYREIGEELGFAVDIDFIVDTVHMHRGEAVPENEMVGVLFCCSVDSQPRFDLSWEHSECRWVTAEEAEGLFPDGHWLLTAIRRAEAVRELASPELLEHLRAIGFS